MDDLIAFIKARLDEDEMLAKASAETWIPFAASAEWQPGTPFNPVSEHIARHDPARVLREVAAKRAIVARYEDCLARMEDPAYPQSVAADQAREYEDFVLPNLAAVWSDHPDYRQEWAP